MGAKKVFNFTLNAVYTDGRYFYRFVKATGKGYDFVNTYTGKLIYRNVDRLYDHRYIGIELPEDHTQVEVKLNAYHAWDRCVFLNSLVPKSQLETVRRKRA